MAGELVQLTELPAVDLDVCASFVITGPETAEVAVGLRDDVKALLAEIEAGYRPHIAQANALHKGLCAELKTRSARPRAVLDALNTMLASYELERRQREEQQARAEEAARVAAAEAMRKAESDAAAAAGDHALALSIASAPVEEFAAPVAVVPAKTEKVSGISVTQTYEAELTDLAQLVAFAHANPAMMAMVVGPNVDGLNALVKQLGEKFAIPGVRRVPKTPSVRSTGRRR